MKVSIRTSILGVLLTLLIGVAVFIIRVNYLTLNAILLETAKQTLTYASNKVGENVVRHFQPILRRAYAGLSLIQDKSIKPEDSKKFINFLHSLLAYEPEIVAVYWADIRGNYFLLKKTSNGQFVSESILPKIQHGMTIEKLYDSNMNLKSTKTFAEATFDPRTKPWFQQAQTAKEHIWYITQLPSNAEKFELGITSANPAFTPKGRLLGVLGFDMPLTAATNFINNIDISANSVLFICDEEENLLTAYAAKKSLVGKASTPKLSDLNMPWIEASFKAFHKKAANVFLFDYNHKKYLAAYRVITTPENKHDWHIAVVTPMRDIIAPLQTILLYSLLVVLTALLLGIIIATYLASRISRPIKSLAENAELICKLELEQAKKIITHIKEISQMADSFNKMRNALNSFQRYVPTKLVKNLVTSGEVAKVGGVTRELTILFSDIENFTPLAEIMSPENLMHYLSDYFQVISKVVLNYNGTIDKYIGDGMMAFWGAPLEDKEHALHACQAALAIKKELQQLNNKWRLEHKPEIATRIGINSGKVIVGNVGSDDRLSYTAIGDAVNLASRLEKANKLYGTYTMLSATTYALVKNNFKLRLIDRIAVKGKKNAMHVYELIDIVPEKPDIKFEAYRHNFASAFACYEKGNWQEALAKFNELAKFYPDDNLLQIFIERCRKFSQHPPEKWDGIWVINYA